MFLRARASQLQVLFVAGLVAAASLQPVSAGAASPAQPGAAQEAEAAPASGSSGASPFNIVNVPGAGTGSLQGTAALYINAAGTVAGVYLDANNVEHGYVRSANGVIATFDAPNTGTGENSNSTVPVGIDAAGDVAGLYSDMHKVYHGFVRTAAGGALKTFSVSGAGAEYGQGTFPTCINAAGEIAGFYVDHSNLTHGFVRSATGSIAIVNAVPISGTSSKDNQGTYVTAINSAGAVVGTYIDAKSVFHGFVRAANGTITPINVPGAGTATNQGTAVVAIDAAGDVGGMYVGASGQEHAFHRTANGTIAPFDAPGAGKATDSPEGTYPYDFDAAGDLAGMYVDANKFVHGFVRAVGGSISTYNAGSSGTVVSVRKSSRIHFGNFGSSTKRSNRFIDRVRRVLNKMGSPNAKSPAPPLMAGITPDTSTTIAGTAAIAIDAAGDIAGIYSDGDEVAHGFLRAASGSITNFNAPNAGTSAEQGTGSFAINASKTIVGTYADAKSVLYGFILNLGNAATTTRLSSAQASSVYGEPVTFTAKVAAGSSVPPNEETISFLDGTSLLGTGKLSGGTATLTTTDLPVGADSIKAVYGGDTSFAGSTSTALTQTVDKADSHTTLVSSLNPSRTGQSVTFTATVTGQFGGKATGSVTFSHGKTSLGTKSLSANAAAISTVALPLGTDSITASYSGDSNFDASKSNAVSQVVKSVTAPTVTTAAATAVNTTKATLHGTVTPNNATTQYWFAWGTSKTALTGKTTKTGALTGATATAVSATLTTLKTKTTYYYQAVASNDVGTTAGAVLSFKTN